ncbi:hypothetical protein Agub_g1132, partial [Astrephomene gubernaculifera]
PGSMMAIYRAPLLMTQGPPSVVRPGDIRALMFAQRRRGRGGGMAGAGARRVVDTPGASQDIRAARAEHYEDDSEEGHGEGADEDEEAEEVEDSEDPRVGHDASEDEEGEGEEEDEEEEAYDPLARRMAKGLKLAQRNAQAQR